jgi:hypothetical protein
MRFIVRAVRDDSHQLWHVTLSLPESKPRTLRRVENTQRPDFFFPQPEDVAPTETDSRLALCTGSPEMIQEVYDRIVTRGAAQAGDPERFGLYLFHTLIGRDWWDLMKQAVHDQLKRIELALSWPENDADLNRLNWEMMHYDIGHSLASEQVGITRMVPVETGEPGILSQPPRMLFVVGTSLSDPEVRPGAEYFGLLRQLRDADMERRVNTRVLLDATTKKLQKQMHSFRPEIVFMLCHGSEEGALEMQLEEGEDKARRWRTAREVCELLRIPGRPTSDAPGAPTTEPDTYPTIVVLSACYGGTVAGAHRTAPLAAQLVAGGIPVVVGMAGEVADSACRLFTRLFGQAILRGEALAVAAARARRAAFALGAPSAAAVDWAFPALYLSQDVGEQYAPTRRDPTPHERIMTAWIRAHERPDEPEVFCGREELLQTFTEILEERQRAVLAVHGNRGFGKSRALRELAAGAILEGHLTFILPFGAGKPPRTFAELREQAVERLKQFCQAHELLPPVPFLLHEISRPLPESRLERITDAELREWVRVEIDAGTPGEAPPLTPRLLRLALQHDLGATLARARGKYSFLGKTGLPIVLLDDVQEYAPEEVATLFKGEFLDTYGLGTASKPIPVALSFEQGGPADPHLRDVVQNPGVRADWLRLHALEKFPEEKDEDLLIYERMLLHPFYRQDPPKLSDRRWFFNEAPKPDSRARWTGGFREDLEGKPGCLADKKRLNSLLRGADPDRFVLEANDDDLLKKLAEE